MLSIIIPTYNRNHLLEKCLFRLQEIIPKNTFSWEVIVSDDSKNCSAKALIQENFPWAKWVKGPEKGPASNRNMGASVAINEWLVFTDDDCLPNKNWLEEYLIAIKKYPDAKAFEGAILPDDWSLLNKDMAECPVNDKGGCFWSANIMIERTLFLEVGGFDEAFTIAAQEDQDIYEKLKQKTDVVFLSSCTVNHPVRIMPILKKISKIPSSVSNYMIFYKKHRPRTIKREIFRGMYIYQKLALASFVKGHFRLGILHILNLFLGPSFFLYYYYKKN